MEQWPVNRSNCLRVKGESEDKGKPYHIEHLPYRMFPKAISVNSIHLSIQGYQQIDVSFL